MSLSLGKSTGWFLFERDIGRYKKTLAQVLSCEFCGISKNTFSQNTSARLLLDKSN